MADRKLILADRKPILADRKPVLADYKPIKGEFKPEPFNQEIMIREILENPDLYKTSLLAVSDKDIRAEDGESFREKIQKFIGDEDVLGVQLMNQRDILITFKDADYMNDLLASCFRFEVAVKKVYYKVDFIPVLPVRAIVKLRLTGIPQALASARLFAIQELVKSLLSDLTNPVLYLEVKGAYYTGDLIVEALTNDLKATCEKLQTPVEIAFQKFIGRLSYVMCLPARAENVGIFRYTKCNVIPHCLLE